MTVDVHHTPRSSGLVIGVDGEQRAYAFRAATRHSRLVRVLKIGLPLCSLVAISLYFVPSRMSFSVGDGRASIESIDVDSGSLKMVKPKLSGVNESYGRYEIRAESATQSVKSPERVHLESISGDVVSPSGDRTTLAAPSGEFHTKKQQLSLSKGVTIEGRDGLLVKLQSATVLFPKQMIISRQPVFMKFRDSEIRAQSLRLHTGEARALFIGNVKVHLERQTQAPRQ